MYNIQTQNENITDNAGDRNLRVIGIFFVRETRAGDFLGKANSVGMNMVWELI